jgi:hypothetical protein
MVPSVSLSEAVQLALSRRPELTALAPSGRRNGIDRLYYKDLAKRRSTWPAYRAGLAGRALTVWRSTQQHDQRRVPLA